MCRKLSQWVAARPVFDYGSLYTAYCGITPTGIESQASWISTSVATGSGVIVAHDARGQTSSVLTASAGL
jgi:hypothetical protein